MINNSPLKCVRGEWQRLPPHSEACEPNEIARIARRSKKPVAVDLFCGAGGLSLGLLEAGFAVVLGVDSDPVCIETRRGNIPGCSLCADLATPSKIGKVAQALKGTFVSLLAAAPPCQPFSRAGRSKIRSLAQTARRRHDKGRELWRSALEIVQRVRPQAVLFENVPGMIDGDDISILARLVEGLEESGYEVNLRRLAARAYSVPQHRERVFVVGIRTGGVFRWPEPIREPVTLRQAIDDLPSVKGGSRVDWCQYGGPQTPLQKWFRKKVAETDQHRVYDHFSRAVREDDLEAFRLMDHSTKYSDLPDHLKRYRDDIFDDKYKRLPWDDVCRTITAHLSKDGYWYIHPEQHRTLTIREAARIQTFPDWFRFTGTPTHQLRQIGNAVPPLMAAAIGRSILEGLRPPKGQARKSHVPVSTIPRQGNAINISRLRNALLVWWASVDQNSLLRPWLKMGKFWQNLLGMVLFERQPLRIVRDFWSMFARRWPTPKAFLADKRRDTALRVLERTNAGKKLDQLARPLSREVTVNNLPAIEGLSGERVRLCAMLAGEGFPSEPTTPAVRVASRLLGEETTDSRLEGQLLLVRVMGASQAAAAYAALLEIAEQFCRPSRPICENCPLRKYCRTCSAKLPLRR